MPATIDAHQHFWQLSQPFDYRWLDAPALAPIRRDYLPDDLILADEPLGLLLDDFQVVVQEPDQFAFFYGKGNNFLNYIYQLANYV